MIRLKAVSKIYPPDTVGVKNIHLHVKPGEFVSIVGMSGSGKSTMVKLLIAEETPTRGDVIIGGWNISRIKRHEVPLLRRQIGVIFQDFRLLPKKTVFENVAFALEVSGERSKKIKEIVPQVLAIVGLEKEIHRYPYQISGGEAQRVAIARALVHRPKILVADEPTGNLDTFNSAEIIQILKRINEFGTTIVLVTHDKDVVNKLKRRVVTIEGGQVVNDQKSGKYIL